MGSVRTGTGKHAASDTSESVAIASRSAERPLDVPISNRTMRPDAGNRNRWRVDWGPWNRSPTQPTLGCYLGRATTCGEGRMAAWNSLPRAPQALFPQHIATPEVFIAQVCFCPAEIDEA